MKDVDIYSLDEFELYSQVRDKSFRFILYTGHNYDRLCEYLCGENNNNISIWPRQKLIAGTIYTIDRHLRLTSVPKYAIRFCIINNSYRVVDGKMKALALTEDQAVAYLKESKDNCIFGYSPSNVKESVVTYSYDATEERFKYFSKEHKLGYSVGSLPPNMEWYIGRHDGLDNLPFHFTISAANSVHSVHFEEDIRTHVDDIARLIFEINKKQVINNKDLIFMPSWEEYARQQTLYAKVTSEVKLRAFVQTLYNYLFESTKDASGRTRLRLPAEFRNNEYIEIVGEFRNFFFHGQSEYVSRVDTRIGDIFLRYTGRREEPMELSDFIEIHVKMLCEFEQYLVKLLDFCKKSVVVEGYIQQDDAGNVYCKNILLPRELGSFSGCQCKLRYFVDNKVSNKNVYPYFCQFPIIFKTIDGIIVAKTMGDGSESLFCGDIMLPARCSESIGQRIIVLSFTPQGGCGESNADLSFNAVDFEVIPDGTHSLSGVVQSKKQGFRSIYYCGNVQLWEKAEQIVGSKIKIVGVIENRYKEHTGCDYYCFKYELL